jgi:hypothetical protein
MLGLFALKSRAITEHVEDLLGMCIRIRVLLPQRQWRSTKGMLTSAAEVQTLHHG